MKKPFKYIVVCNKTNEITETNILPSIHRLQTWEDTNIPNIKALKQTKTVYEDIRYKAKLRLYNYITYTKNGLDIPKYKPFEGTQIGVSIPILNF